MQIGFFSTKLSLELIKKSESLLGFSKVSLKGFYFQPKLKQLIGLGVGASVLRREALTALSLDTSNNLFQTFSIQSGDRVPPVCPEQQQQPLPLPSPTN